MELTKKPRETRRISDGRQDEGVKSRARRNDLVIMKALVQLWENYGAGSGSAPPSDELSVDTQAEVLWRVGALSGWLGSANEIPGAQEFARDLLTESITLFESLDQQDKRAEAMGDLALCYWRSGAQDEGRALFRQAVEAAQKSETKLRTLTNASTVEISSGRYGDALALLNAAAAFLAEVSDDWIHGAYHYQRGLAYRRLGGTENLDHALIEYSAASMRLAKAGHIRYFAGVENNIGFIHHAPGKSNRGADSSRQSANDLCLTERLSHGGPGQRYTRTSLSC